MAIDAHKVTVADSTGHQLYLHFTLLGLSNVHLLDGEWLATLTPPRCFQFIFLKDAVAKRLLRQGLRQGSGKTYDQGQRSLKYTTGAICLRKG